MYDGPKHNRPASGVRSRPACVCAIDRVAIRWRTNSTQMVLGGWRCWWRQRKCERCMSSLLVAPKMRWYVAPYPRWSGLGFRSNSFENMRSSMVAPSFWMCSSVAPVVSSKPHQRREQASTPRMAMGMIASFSSMVRMGLHELQTLCDTLGSAPRMLLEIQHAPKRRAFARAGSVEVCSSGFTSRPRLTPPAMRDSHPARRHFTLNVNVL